MFKLFGVKVEKKIFICDAISVALLLGATIGLIIGIDKYHIITLLIVASIIFHSITAWLKIKYLKR